MEILLVRPKPDKETIGLQHVMICEPLELEYLVANIPEAIAKQVSCRIIDMIIEKKSLIEFVQKHKPKAVLFTSYITHVNTIKAYSKEIKKLDSNCITMVGGVHADVVPMDFLDVNIDIIVTANGIKTFKEIIKCLVNNRSVKEIKKISGVFEKEKVYSKEKDFDYNFPDRKVTNKYRSKYYYMFHNPCALIKTSFGCQYNCSFCFCREVTDRQYYERTIESVVEELKNIEEKEIYIVDDNFLYSRDRLNQFYQLIKKEKINKKYLVYGRADFIADNEEIIKKLSEVGLRAVIVGLESFRQKDLEKYNKLSSIKINEKAINVLNNCNIELYGTFIIPLDFTKKDFKDLRNWLIKNNIIFINLQPLTPLKGTDIYKEYSNELIVNEEEYEKWDMAHIVLKPQMMSIRRYYIEIIKSYYLVTLRPRNIVRLLRQYGLKENFKLFIGSSYVMGQYVKKVFRITKERV